MDFVPGTIFTVVRKSIQAYQVGVGADRSSDLCFGDLLLIVGEERCKGYLFNVMFSARLNSLVSVLRDELQDLRRERKIIVI